MKKFICGFLIGAMLFGVLGVFAVSYVANPLSYKVLVNGEEFTSDPPPVEIEGRTYLPLRAMGDALGVPVNWNEELRRAEVGMSPNSGTIPQKTENPSGYITYEEKTWCPDFGRWVGRTPHVDFPREEDGSHVYIYKGDGITMNDIKGYLKIFNSMGYKVGAGNNVYNCRDDNGTLKLGIAIRDNEIYVIVY